MSLQIKALDHLVLTVRSIEASLAFYTTILGLEAEIFGENRHALTFGTQKINLHQAGSEFEPKADRPTPGSADLCFLTDTPLDFIIAHLEKQAIAICQGPIRRTGATGPLLSIYIRDPDQNLIEIANQQYHR